MSFLKKLFGIKTTEVKKEEYMSIEKAKEIVHKLEILDYFQYSAPEHIEFLKENLVESIHNFGILSTKEVMSPPFTPLDYRYYSMDGESLFEQGGILDALDYMQPGFERMGLRIVIGEHYEEYGNSLGLTHWIVINDKKYSIHENLEGYGWDEAAWKYCDMINDQMTIQNKSERLYLINGGNDGSAVFLTGEQFLLIDTISSDKNWKPLTTIDWKKWFKI